MLADSHGGLSVQFSDRVAPLIEEKERRAVIRRRQINIHHVACVPIPAYAGAGITALREEDLEVLVGETPNIEAVEKLLAELRR